MSTSDAAPASEVPIEQQLQEARRQLRRWRRQQHQQPDDSVVCDIDCAGGGCGREFGSSAGVTCTDCALFLCNRCFGVMVRTECEAGQRFGENVRDRSGAIVSASGQLPCPLFPSACDCGGARAAAAATAAAAAAAAIAAAAVAAATAAAAAAAAATAAAAVAAAAATAAAAGVAAADRRAATTEQACRCPPSSARCSPLSTARSRRCRAAVLPEVMAAARGRALLRG